MSTWKTALQNAATAKATVVFIGSSTTQGAGSSTRTRRYINLMDAMLRRRDTSITDTHDYYNLSADNPSYSTTGTVTIDYQGLGSQTWQLAAGATMSFTATCKQFTVYFVQGPSYGSFTYRIDGGSAVTVTPSTATPDNTQSGFVDIDTGSSASHTILITATNMCKINGIMIHSNRTDRGLFCINSGIGGAVSGDFSFRVPYLMPRLNQVAPNLILYMTGSNDFSGQVSRATYASNIQTFIDGIRAGVSSNPDILLVQPYKRFDISSPTIPWEAYGRVQQDLANSNPGCYYVDISGPYPSSQANDPYDIITSDNIHQSDRGHALMARLLMSSFV